MNRSTPAFSRSTFLCQDDSFKRFAVLLTTLMGSQASSLSASAIPTGTTIG